MSEDPFVGRAPRHDRDEDFPAELVETLGPALLGQTGGATAALVAMHLLRHASLAGGSRVSPASIDEALAALCRAVSAESQRWCEDEALRIARWCVHEPEPDVGLRGDRALMAVADALARVQVVEWAIEHGLDLEIEWYDADDERWPRMRVTPLRIESAGDEKWLVVKTSMAEIEIAVANVRWVMPVERRAQAAVPMARVLDFPRFGQEE